MEVLLIQKKETLDFLEKLNIDGSLNYEDLESGELDLPVYRTLYLDKLLKGTSMNVYKSKEYKDLINDIQNVNDEYIKIPKGLNATLRRYQEIVING